MKSGFSEFGYPDKIHSDCGSQYSSQELNSFTIKYAIKHSMPSPYNHERKGESERYVGIMKKLFGENVLILMMLYWHIDRHPFVIVNIVQES